MSAKPIKAGYVYQVTHRRRTQVVFATNAAHAIEIYLSNMGAL